MARLTTASRLTLLVSFILQASAHCPAMCSGRGRCETGSTCSCFSGWTGPSCADRVCPKESSWVSYGQGGTDDVHNVVAECAGVGTCVRKSGLCICPAPFSGEACQRLGCVATGSNSVCSDHGRCVTLAGAAELGLSTGSPAFPYEASTFTAWEAERIQGCVCDQGWTGADCSQALCPSGSDPVSVGEARIEAIRCECRGGACSRKLMLRIGSANAVLPANAVGSTADEQLSAARGSGYAPGESVESILRALSPEYFGQVTVTGSGVCVPGSDIEVTFLKAAGNSIRLFAEAVTDSSTQGLTAPMVSVAVIREASTENAPCSNRGVCDTGNGQCRCFPGFFSSDGNGNPGVRGDCGSLREKEADNITTVSACMQKCNNRGWCDVAAGYVCRCSGNAYGSMCQFSKCPTGPAWFDQPSPDGIAHRAAACSNAGKCQNDGTCRCYAGFTGSACDRLVCPGGGTCSGHGVCLPLRELVRSATGGGEPRGGGTRPIQTLTCSLSRGALTFTYKWATSVSLAWDASPEDLSLALSNIPTIGIVEVTPQLTVVDGKWVTPDRICSGSAQLPHTMRLRFVHDVGVVDALSVEHNGPDNDGEVTIDVESLGNTSSYGATELSRDTWDANMIYGCHCDGYPEWNSTSVAYGDRGAWVGPACALRSCPSGVNPSFEASVREEQRLTCVANAGSFTLTFRGETTAPLDFDVTVRELIDALEDLDSIGLVDISLEGTLPESADYNAANRVCGWDQSIPRSVRIKFLTELGDLPLLNADASYLFGPNNGAVLATLEISEVTTGVGRVEECSGQGICDGTTGLCSCFESWLSSDGAGAEGGRGDCGARRGSGL